MAEPSPPFSDVAPRKPFADVEPRSPFAPVAPGGGLPSPKVTPDEPVAPPAAVGGVPEPSPAQHVPAGRTSDFIQAPARTYKTEEGAEVNFRIGPTNTKAALRLFKGLPDQPLQDYVLTKGLTGDPFLVAPDDIKAAQEPAWYETMFGWLEPFDYPRRYAWQLLAGAGTLLPNPSDPGKESETMTQEVGDALSWAASKAAPVLAGVATGGTSIVAMYGDHHAFEDMGENFYNALSRGTLWDKGIEKSKPFPWHKEWTIAPYLSGRDVLDQIVPIDMAEKMAEVADNPAKRAFWGSLSSEFGREMMGISAEIALDPLWLIGPAKGTQAVRQGNHVYELSRPLARGASAAARMTGESTDAMGKLFVRIVTEPASADTVKAKEVLEKAAQATQDAAALRDADAVKLAASLADPARAGVQAAEEVARERTSVEAVIRGYIEAGKETAESLKNPAEAARKAAVLKQQMLSGQAKLRAMEKLAAAIKEPAAATRYLTAQLRRAQSEARAFGRNAEQIRSAARIAGEAGEGVQKAGGVTWHMPFAGDSKWLMEGGIGARSKALLPTWALRTAGDAADVLKPFGSDAIAAKRALGSAAHWTVGEEFALAMHRSVGGALMLPKVAWHVLSVTLGDRAIQPLVSRIRSAAELEQFGAKGRHLAQVPFLGGSKWLTLERVAPEVWNNYQGAVTGYFRRLAAMESDLMNATIRVTKSAAESAKLRKFMAERDLPRVKADIRAAEAELATGGPAARVRLHELRTEEAKLSTWASDAYGAQDVLIEVTDLVGRGAGKLQTEPWLVPVAAAIEDMVKMHAEKAGKEVDEVRQALVNMVRFLRGDMHERDELVSMIIGTRQALAAARTDEAVSRAGIQRAAHAGYTRLRMLRDVLSSITPEKMADVLETVRFIEERGGAVGQAGVTFGRGAWFDRLLTDALGGDTEQAGEIVRRLLAGTGASSKDEAVDILVAHMRGGDVAEAQKIVGSSVRDYIDHLDLFADELKHAARAGFDAYDEGHTISAYAAFAFEQELAKARAIVGSSDWAEFSRWADLKAANKPAGAPPWHRPGPGRPSVFEAPPKAPPAGAAAIPAPVVDDALGAQAFLDLGRTQPVADVTHAPTDALIDKTMRGIGRGGKPPVEAIAKTAPMMDKLSAEAAFRAYMRARRWAFYAGVEAKSASGRVKRGFAAVRDVPGTLVDRRMEELAQAARSEAEVVEAVRAGLGRMIPTDDPLIAKWADVIAARMGGQLWAAPRVGKAAAPVIAGETATQALHAGKGEALADLSSISRELAEARKAKLAEGRDVLRSVTDAANEDLAILKAKLALVEPKLVPPDATDGRKLVEWERDLWRDFSARFGHLSDQDRTLAAFTALRHAPDLPSQLGAMYDKIAASYPRVLGRRLGEVPPELVPAVEQMTALIKSYEALYIKHGFTFVKSPLDMMKLWGVIDYAPHMAARESLAMRDGAVASATLSLPGGGAASYGDLDARFSMHMDAARRRTLEGTIRELNDVMDGTRFTVDPHLLLARYTQANKSIASQEFLAALLKGGVLQPVAADGARSATQVANDLDMVPLFRAPDVDLDYALLIKGDPAVWANLTPDQAARWIETVKAWATGEAKGPTGSAFASWLHEAPIMQQAANVEETLFRIREAELLAVRNAGGVAITPFDPLARKAAYVAGGLDDAVAWDRVARDMLAHLREQGAAAPLRSPSGVHLSAYFEGDQALWKLYVPRTVAQSMRDLFELEKELPRWGKPALDAINRFFKVRLTVASIAFTSRNALSNVLTNTLDLGPFGALNPVTNYRATQIAGALPFFDVFGSLEKASEALRAGRQAGETLTAFARRKAHLQWFQASGADTLLTRGVDLGDGIVRPVDEAIQLLKDNGVVSGAFTQVSDIGRLETGLAEIMHVGGLGTTTDKIAHGASIAEDWAMIGLSAGITGGLPVAVGKKAGAELARWVENQARLCNFMGNYRRSGDVRQAADHVAKFLFDYGDLTAVQRVWIRTLIPFFTWTQKNILLQADMMQKSPIFYSQFNHFINEVPRLSEAIDADAEGRDPMYWDPASAWRLRLRQKHTRSAIRVPLPKAYTGVRGAYFEGLGLPMEAFVEQTSMLANLSNPDNWFGQAHQLWDEKPAMRLLSQSHFMLKMIAELGSGQQVFYDRPINTLTNGALVAQVVDALRKTPLVGEYLAEGLTQGTGLLRLGKIDKRTGEWGYDAVVLGQPNWIFANLPWTRAIRDAAAATDVHHTSLAANIAEERAAQAGHTPETGDLPMLARWLDAFTGVRLVSEDIGQRERVFKKRFEEASRRQTEQRAAMSTFELPTVRSQ